MQISIIGDPSYRPAAIPLGDINGDGFADYIAAVKDNLSGTGFSYARVVFGSATGTNLGFTLKLTAPVLYPTSATQAQSFFAEPGDYNGDGKDDILIAVTTPTGAAVAGLEQAVYLIFGSGAFTGEYDVYGQADVRIVGTAAAGALLASTAGNVNGDVLIDTVNPLDDFLITQGNNAYLFYGKGTWASGDKLKKDFNNGLQSFVLDGGASSLWHRHGDSLIGVNEPPSNGILLNDATIFITIDGANPVSVSVTALSTSTNTTIDHLIADLNVALATAGLGTQLEAYKYQIGSSNRLALRPLGTTSSAKFT